MTVALNWTLAELLPHAGNAILLDAIIHCDDEHICARANIRPGLYSDENGDLPGWMGLELMAQSVAAWAGVCAKRTGQAIEPGFLIGTRRYECHVPAFHNGHVLQIDARSSLEDSSGLGVFECDITSSDLLARARLNVYRPPNVTDYLYEPAHEGAPA